MLIFVFVFFFVGSSAGVELAPHFAAQAEPDISAQDQGEAVASHAISLQASRFRPLRGKLAARVSPGPHGWIEPVYSEEGARLPRASIFFPRQALYRLQEVYRR